MHELSVAREIIGIVQDEMTRCHLTRVTEVKIRLGVLAGLNADALAFGFEASVVDTPLADTRLIIENIPIDGVCRTCGKEFEVEEFVFICPRCGGTDMDIRRGEELDIEHLVGEQDTACPGPGI